MIKRIGLALKDSSEAYELAKEMRAWLRRRGVKCILEKTPGKPGFGTHELREIKADVIVALGGDGTILRALSEIKRDTPLLGINLGTEGYLARIEPSEWKEALARVLRGDYTVEKRARINVIVGGKVVNKALNEAVVAPSEPVKMLNFEVLVDGCRFFTARADGIIVATPVGSTAYSLSAGGSIVDLRVPALIITPICPYNSGVHPVVVPQNSEIKVRVIKTRRDAVVVVDGEYKRELGPAKEAVFRLAKERVSFIGLEK